MLFILAEFNLQTDHIFWFGVVIAFTIGVDSQSDLAENIVRVYYHQ